MLAPRLKQSIDLLWNRFWSGGIANPLTAIEQITYLVFLKRLEDLDLERERVAREAGRSYASPYFGDANDQHRWSNIRLMPAKERLDYIQAEVFRWLKNIPGVEDRMRDAVFIIPSSNLLTHAMEIIDELFDASNYADLGDIYDVLGDIYEYLLSEIAEAGKNGQFRTPRHIIRAMCDLIDPQLGERICDPACGTAGFLVLAYQHILKQYTNPQTLEFEADGSPVHAYGDQLSSDDFAELRRNHLYGFDFDRTMVRLGWMNMTLHGLERPEVNYADSLGSGFYDDVISGNIMHFQKVLANPPFKGNIDKEDIHKELRWLGTKTELLFIGLILELLAIGGRAAVIVPEGVLFGSAQAHQALRRKLIEENLLDAVISLPGGVFQPYTGVKSSILVFTKGAPGVKTEQVWFYDVGADGQSLNAKRAPRAEQNDLWDMALKYRLQFGGERPAFADETTWREWSALAPEQRGLHYAQPIIANEERATGQIAVQPTLFDQQEHVTVAMFKGLRRDTLDTAKDWVVSAATLAENEYRLDAGFYKAESVDTLKYDPPQQIIGDLLEIEEQLTEGLKRLMSMLERVE
jgi:type I restriction enzyme M protein